ncbi:MAG: DUF4276 family protein [Bryobacterales bacterium]|nr:DUF4276 family protein [Bryobacterales bacterium]
MTVKLYVEGGGNQNKSLQTECRRGFSEFIKKAGMEGRMPRIVACGGRQEAYKNFRNAHETDRQLAIPVLLVDSEGPVTAERAWHHVRDRPGDRWECPDGVTEDQIHLMVQVMEAWFFADKSTLGAYFGHRFQETALSERRDLENVPKSDIFTQLSNATRQTAKGQYSKGKHSFEILSRIDPGKVRDASSHAERFLETLDRLTSHPYR